MSDYPDIKTPDDPYATYIERIRAYFDGLCFIIAEVGLPSAWGSSQFGFDGRNQGALEEQVLAERLLAVLQIIRDRNVQGWCARARPAAGARDR